MTRKHRYRKWLAALLALLLCCAMLPVDAFAEDVPVQPPAAEEAAPELPKETEAPPPETQPPEPDATPVPAATPAPEQTAEAEITPTPEIETTPVPELTPEPEVTPVPEATPEAEITPEPETTPEPEITPVPENTPEAEMTPEPETTPEPEVTPVPETTPEVEMTPEPETTLEPEITPVPEITLDPGLMPEASDAPLPSPTPSPTPEPTPEVEGCVIAPKSDAYEDYHLNARALDIPGDGMPIPRFYQSSYKTPVCSIYGEIKSVHTSGCGAAAASMLIAYIKQDYDQTPYTLFRRAVMDGDYFGYGLGYDTIQDMLSRYGIDGRLESVSSDRILKSLSEGRPVIIKMGPGTFTAEGHYIVLRGLDEDGLVLVNDPSSRDRSKQGFPVKLIVREAKDSVMLVAHTRAKGVPVPTPTPTPAPKSTPVPVAVMPAAADATMAPAVDVPRGRPAVVAADRVNLRLQPVNGDVAFVAEAGTPLSILQETPVQADGHVWCRVLCMNQLLYIRSDMIHAE